MESSLLYMQSSLQPTDLLTNVGPQKSESVPIFIDQRSVDPTMIPTQPPIDIAPIFLPLVGTTQCCISTPSNLFPSLNNVRIESPVAPSCDTTCPVEISIHPYDSGTTACSYHVWIIPQVRTNQMTTCCHLANQSKP